MAVNILMPALSPTMEAGNLTRWLKRIGDTVKPGDLIAEIETDKATMEIEAIDEGVLGEIVVPDGTADVAVNTVIGVLVAERSDTSPIRQDLLQGAAARPYETDNRSSERSAISEILGAAARAPTARIVISPLARRLAREADIALGTIVGSGTRGRIIGRDVLAAIAGAATPHHAPAAAAFLEETASASSRASDVVRNLFAAGSFGEIPHDPMRRAIARRLTESKSTVPHFYLSTDCSLDALVKLRAELNATISSNVEEQLAFRLSMNDFFIKAQALALATVPAANVTWTEDAMLQHRHSDLSVAVATPGGFVTPVIQRADEKSLSIISRQMRDFVERAKARTLKPEDYSGGTSTLSNLGMFGVTIFQAIINPPQATILAIGKCERRHVTDGDVLAAGTAMSVTLSLDHRAVDGVVGAYLLESFKSLIENPLRLLV